MRKSPAEGLPPLTGCICILLGIGIVPWRTMENGSLDGGINCSTGPDERLLLRQLLEKLDYLFDNSKLARCRGAHCAILFANLCSRRQLRSKFVE